jgi:HAD superfamily hydrolase (TIGR01509 family)
MKPKAIIFDCFGVLCTEIADVWFGERLSPETRAIARNKYCPLVDSGAISETEFFNTLAGYVSGDGPSIREEWLTRLVLDKEVIEFVRALRPRYKTAICSNVAKSFFQEIRAQHQLDALFDDIIISGEVGSTKPDPVIFNTVLSRLAVSPAEAIFIDDNPKNVKGAEAVGIRGVLFADATQLKRDLGFLLLN